MKAITLWQPWATMIVLGLKRIETRSWKTPHRGPLVIHAAKRKPTRELDRWVRGVVSDYCGSEMLDRLPTRDEWPLGQVLAVADLVDCRPMDLAWCGEVAPLEIDLGDWSLGRYGWILRDVHPIVPPLPAGGLQKLWDWLAPWEVGEPVETHMGMIFR